MNWYSIFYFLTIGDKLSELFLTGVFIFTILFLISAIGWAIQTFTESSEFPTTKPEETRQQAKARIVAIYRNSMLGIGTFYAVLWLLYIAIPSRKEALFIIAGGGVAEFATSDTSMRQIPAEMSNFVLTGLRNMSMEEGIELLQGDAKERALKKASEMSPNDLIEKMKTDSNFAKLILK